MRKPDFFILYFFLISFAGWLWEGGIYFVTEQTLVNRGAFYGPYLPIYGVGGLLLWFLLHSFHEKKGITFLGAAVICSLLEYAVGMYMKWRWDRRWWDYSGQFLNLNGHICLLSGISFGFGGVLLNCYIMPYYIRFYHRISFNWRRIICGFLLLLFGVDLLLCLLCPHTGENIATWIYR